MTAIAFCRYEVVDEVMTLTLSAEPVSAEPVEEGLVVHFMHATCEDDDHIHEVANHADDSAETAVSRWSREDRMLPADRVTEVRRHLTEILVDVPETADMR